jgi:predicted transcriptional regulator
MLESPFKFLSAYRKEDKKIFFGRQKESAQLYNAVFAANLTLLYGASGTGKTSLVQCGLGNLFIDTDWLPLFIRRGTNINQSLFKSLREAAGQQDHAPAANLDTTSLTIPALKAQVLDLYYHYYRPVFLIFDQLEEIYILGTEPERKQFYQFIKALSQSKLPVKIILIIREEWMAYLNDFERDIPSLFDNRLRVEKMTTRNLVQVIAGTCNYFQIDILNKPQTVIQMIDNIRDKKEGVELTHLQVYLDHLYKKDLQRKSGGRKITFDLLLVNEIGKMKNVLTDFLSEQVAQLECELQSRGLENAKGIPLEILYALVTEQGTKRALEPKEILEILPKNRGLTLDTVIYCLEQLYKLKILRQVEDLENPTL